MVKSLVKAGSIPFVMPCSPVLDYPTMVVGIASKDKSECAVVCSLDKVLSKFHS